MSDTVLRLAEEPAIAGCVEQMGQVQEQIWLLHTFAEQEVASEAGFRGVFAALRPALADLTAATREVAEHFASSYGEVIGAVEQSARGMRVCDDIVDDDFRRLVTRWAASQ